MSHFNNFLEKSHAKGTSLKKNYIIIFWIPIICNSHPNLRFLINYLPLFDCVVLILHQKSRTPMIDEFSTL